MENKDIDKAAREYASRNGLYPDDSYTYLLRYRTYLSWYKRLRTAVSQSRQSEIDELREALGDLKAAVESYDEQDEISIRLYESVLDKATQLLKRYENEKDNKG